MGARTSQYRKVEAAALDRRGAGRVVVKISRATARDHGAAPVDATLADVSVYGCRLSFADGSAEDERIWLRLDGSLPIAATVMWREASMIGCRFDTPIPRDLMRSLTIQG